MGRLHAILPVLAIGVLLSCCSSRKTALTAKQDNSTDIATQKTEGTTTYFSPSKVDNLKKNSLFVFVGEKIEISRLPQKEDAFDVVSLAKYKIIEKIYGDYSKDIIEFEVFDHYGEPRFSKYRYVLLFVSAYKGKLYHEKYQYFDVYKTKDGKWASPYPTDDYKHEYNKNTSIKPVKIEFAEDVSDDVSKMKKATIKEWYPAPYYQINQSKAKAIYGNYIPELFKLKRDGVLKARELF